MMKLAEIAAALGCTILIEGSEYPDGRVSTVVASDLMSDVLVVEEESFVILTSLTSEQVVRTADLVGCPGIVLVNGKKPQPAMKKLASDQGVSIFSTPLSSYRACIALGKLESRGQT